MRISIIGSRGYPYVYSGYETFVKELSERLVVQGYQVRVYCHKNLFKNRPKILNGIELVYIPTIETKSLSQLVHSFLSMLHACTTKSTIILAVNAANGPWGLISKIAGIPSLINVDGMEWLRPKWKGLGAKYFKFAAWLSTRLYNQIITDAEAMRQVYLTEFKKDSTVIAYGADIRYSQDASLIHQFNLEPEEYYLIVGRLIPDNNSHLLLDGFLASNSPKKLVIVGDVPYKDAYASAMKARASEQVIFLGYITNPQVLAELYHHCFAYMHGHAFGGTNPTLLKAMAYGCAIMAIDTPFSREMLQNGIFGFLFQQSPRAVAELIQSAEENKTHLNSLRRQVRAGITPKYQWEHVTAAYICVFKALKQHG